MPFFPIIDHCFEVESACDGSCLQGSGGVPSCPQLQEKKKYVAVLPRAGGHRWSLQSSSIVVVGWGGTQGNFPGEGASFLCERGGALRLELLEIDAVFRLDPQGADNSLTERDNILT